jgi:hypothetical protein
MRNRTRPFLVVCTAAAIAVACGRKENIRATDSAAGTVVAPITVSSIDIGRSLAADKGIADKTDSFRTTDTIYASVATDGTGSGTLRARWTFQDGQVVDESSQAISPTGPARTEFHISKPGGWPIGKYHLEVTLNDKVVGTKDFEVK